MKNNLNFKNKQIKVIVFGATGKAGSRLIKAALSQNYEVTAFVRNKKKMLKQLGTFVPKNLHIITGDILNKDLVGKTIKGHNAAVNAAAHARNMEHFHNICKIVVKQADKYLSSPKRLWLFGGIPALDFPNTNIMGLDLPFFPSVYKIHKKNYELLKNSDTDWSFMCPGSMMPIESLDHEKKIRTSTEVMPFEVQPWLLHLPKAFYTLTFKNRVLKLAISYEAVANLVMTNLQARGPYYKKRVGISANVD